MTGHGGARGALKAEKSWHTLTTRTHGWRLTSRDKGVPHRFRSNDQAPRPRPGRLAAYALAAVLGFAVLLSFGLGPTRAGGCWWVRTTSCGWCRSSTGPTARVRTTWCSGVSIRPAGVGMHWSRLADLPPAAVITLAEPWPGRPGAVNLPVLVVPPLLGRSVCRVVPRTAVPLTPNRGGALRSWRWASRAACRWPWGSHRCRFGWGHRQSSP